MKLPIVGPAYEHPSQDVNYQRCVNMYQSSGGPLSRNKEGALLPTPGLKEVVDLSGNEVRALMRFDEKLYAVVDQTVYLLNYNEDSRTATGTSIGTVASQEGQIIWARNPTQIMLADEAKGYIITVSTDTVEEITDPDFNGASTITFMDSYFIYSQPNSTVMYATAINDGTTISALDFASAEGNPDKLVGVISDKRELWAFGEESIEIWFNAANPTGFPFSRTEGAHFDIGCASARSIIKFDNGLMWLDNRGFVIRSMGYKPEIVSTEAISKEIQSYKVISDSWAYQYQYQGNQFYVITFPTAKKTWAWNATNNTWFELAYWNGSDFEHHIVNTHIQFKHSHLVGDRKSGKIYVLDSNTFKDGDDVVHRIRTTPHLNSEFFQVGISELQLHMEVGRALQSGIGADPQIMMRYSNDGGYTWSNELSRSMGKVGEYGKLITWNRLGSAREWLFEFRISDPVGFALIDASLRLEGDNNS